ncbi:MAG: hypothetical protein ABSG76_22445, partial [Xanthobacteraceae bacterium]
PSAGAEAKTAKACQDEWRAAKADFQAKGITLKAYVAQCRAGTVAAPAEPPPPAAAPAPPPAAAAPPPAGAAAKTAKACQDEWRAAKADFQAKGITLKAYVAQCRAGTLAAPAEPPAPAAAPAPPPAAAAPPPAAPPPVRPAAAPRAAPAPTATTAPTGAGQFAAETEAKAHCSADLVVWANLESKIYHFAGHRSYGTTKKGAYMCEKDAIAQGMRASKTEKRPS